MSGNIERSEYDDNGKKRGEHKGRKEARRRGEEDERAIKRKDKNGDRGKRGR